MNLMQAGSSYLFFILSPLILLVSNALITTPISSAVLASNALMAAPILLTFLASNALIAALIASTGLDPVDYPGQQCSECCT